MNKPIKIHYFYDALCGWCYGFSAVVTQLWEKYKEELDFEVYSGGMVTGERVGPIGQVAPYIKDAYKTVEKASGVTFGQPFLDKLQEGSTVIDSIPACKVLSMVKQEKPEISFPFASKLQSAVYQDGIETSDINAFEPYLAEIGISKDRFAQLKSDPGIDQLTEQDFKVNAQMGVQGFPTMVAQIEDEYFLMTRGFAPFEKMDDVFGKLIDYAKAKGSKG